MPEALFRGIVKAGRFNPDDIARHGAWLARAEGKRVIMSLKRERLGRTLSQNRYYWGVVLATLADWCGHEPEELHEHFKRALLEPQDDELPSGQVITTYPSTTTLTVQKFTQYVEEIARWAAEQGVYIPSSDEVGDV